MRKLSDTAAVRRNWGRSTQRGAPAAECAAGAAQRALGADATGARHALGRSARPCEAQRRVSWRGPPEAEELQAWARAGLQSRWIHPGGGMPTHTAGVPGVLGRQDRYSQHWRRGIETLNVRFAPHNDARHALPRLRGGLARLVGVQAASFADNGALRLGCRWRFLRSCGAVMRCQQQRANAEPAHRCADAGCAASAGEEYVRPGQGAGTRSSSKVQPRNESRATVATFGPSIPVQICMRQARTTGSTWWRPADSRRRRAVAARTTEASSSSSSSSSTDQRRRRAMSTTGRTKEEHMSTPMQAS